MAAYAIVAGGWLVVPLAGIIGPGDTTVSLIGVAVLVAILRYLTPLSAELLDDGVRLGHVSGHALGIAALAAPCAGR